MRFVDVSRFARVALCTCRTCRVVDESRFGTSRTLERVALWLRFGTSRALERTLERTLECVALWDVSRFGTLWEVLRFGRCRILDVLRFGP